MEKKTKYRTNLSVISVPFTTNPKNSIHKYTGAAMKKPYAFFYDSAQLVTFSNSPVSTDTALSSFLKKLRIEQLYKLLLSKGMTYERLLQTNKQELAEIGIQIGPRNRILQALGKIGQPQLTRKIKNRYSRIKSEAGDFLNELEIVRRKRRSSINT